jgi:ferredoxin
MDMAVTKVWVEEDCTLCGVCEDLCGDVFSMGEETTTIIDGADLEANTDCIKEAAENCPVEIIKFEEE